MRVIVSDRVRQFLHGERQYLGKHSTTAHKRLTLRMRETARLLAEFPMAGAESPLPLRGLRRLVVDDYVLDCEIEGDEVRILNMRHGRQRDPYLEYDDDADYEI